MKRLFLTIVLALTMCFCFSQHLTYSTFMKVSKMENVSEISSTLRSYGYIFNGSNTTYSDSDSTNITVIVWTKNCRVDLKTDAFWGEEGKTYSLLKYATYEKSPWLVYVEYIFPSQSDYELFLKTAKQNGFEFNQDLIEENDIQSIYFRLNEKQNYIDRLAFVESSNALFRVALFRAPIAD